MTKAETPEKIHITLIGASVGKSWNLPELPARIHNTNYHFEYIGLYQFDKTPALKELIARNTNKPNAIVLKECAAYFPGDVTFAETKSLIKKWVNSCQQNNIVPVLATVCPITEVRDERYKTTNPLKRYVKRLLNISMMTCMDRIREYNDWIKRFAAENNLSVLDLEAPLSISREERYLDAKFAKPDGLHLNETAYETLDKIVVPTLDTIDFSNYQKGK